MERNDRVLQSPAGQHLLDAQPKIAQEYMPLVMQRTQERTKTLTARNDEGSGGLEAVLESDAVRQQISTAALQGAASRKDTQPAAEARRRMVCHYWIESAPCSARI